MLRPQRASLWTARHDSVMTSTGSALALDLCLRLRCLWGAGGAAGAAELTERERRSAKGYVGAGAWPAGGSAARRSLSVSWRHLSKQPAAKVWWAPR